MKEWMEQLRKEFPGLKVRSDVPYAELTNIMAMVGSVYFNSLLFVKCCERTSIPLIPLTVVTVLLSN